MARIAGTCYVKVDGQQLSVQGSLEVPLITSTRETLLSTAGVAGYSEAQIAPYVSVTAYITDKTTISTLTEGDSMTITAELANGKVYTLQEAYLAGEVAYSPSDGTATLRFEGVKGDFQE